MNGVLLLVPALLPCLMMLGPSTVSAHPLHTSMTRITVAADASVSVAVRVFADDFSAAVARARGTAASADFRVTDSDAAGYLSGALAIVVDGKRIALQLVRQRRDGDVTWIELRGACRGDLSKATILNEVLMDLHRDQVNIVQVVQGNDSRTLLFSAGDRARKVRKR